VTTIIKKMPEVTIVVLGAGAVGKSCLSIQYVQGHFVERYDSTIEDVYRKPTTFDGESMVLTIVDTAGQDTFGTMREQYMRSGQAFVLVYSLTDPDSLQKLKVIYAQLRRIRGEEAFIPCVAVGNKIDLGAQRAVPRDAGQEFARLAQCQHFEVTARDRAMVDGVFSHVVQLARSGPPQPGAGVNPLNGAGPGAHGQYMAGRAGGMGAASQPDYMVGAPMGGAAGSSQGGPAGHGGAPAVPPARVVSEGALPTGTAVAGSNPITPSLKPPKKRRFCSIA
jgi:small GTP-binding protein